MNVQAASLGEIEAAIDSTSDRQRIEKLRRVTDLFVAGADYFSEEHLAIFDRLLLRLIEQIEAAVLAEIGERLAPIRNAPFGVVRSLAYHDEIAVAGPLLSRSERLAVPDLVQIAETKSQAHLLAISHRARVEDKVTDVLVRRGDDQVVRTVAANEGACFSETGMNTLADRAERDELLAEKVVQRPDVPRHIFCKLLVAATGIVRERLLAVLAPEARAEADRILDKVAGELADQAPVPHCYGEAIRRVLFESSRGKLGEETLLAYAAKNQVDEAIAALSLLSSAPTDDIDRFFATREYESLLVVCKAAGLSWGGAQAVIQLNLHGSALPPARIAELESVFAGLKSSDAQHMLRLWSIDR